ncbi:hypothetical protein GCM10009809_11070 [Isoptericola hypogeus]|uniref:DUF1761 domain-containing protein n=1 Tax=Isoptericola hypogeus TaxID=300179 RepID=A0ABN2J2P5_9MICO
MAEAIGAVEWLAVAAATLASYVLGALWFTPLFGRAWDASLGHDRAAHSGFGPLYYVAPLVGSALTTTATALVLALAGVTGVGEAAVVGLVLGVGFGTAVTFVGAVNPRIPRPGLFTAVTGGYQAASAVLAAVVLAAWG